jgi:hypothetical protein
LAAGRPVAQVAADLGISLPVAHAANTAAE